MSFVGFCSNSSVSPSSSDPNLYTPSAPGYVYDGPAWPINPGNSAFNGITLSVDEESCRSPWCKTVSFFFFPQKKAIATSRHCLFTSFPVRPALQYAKQESFPTKLSMTEPKTTSFTSRPFGYLPFDEPSSRHSFYKLTNHLLRRCGQSGRSKTKLPITYHLVESSNQGLPIFLDSKWLTAAMATRTLFR